METLSYIITIIVINFLFFGFLIALNSIRKSIERKRREAKEQKELEQEQKELDKGFIN